LRITAITATLCALYLVLVFGTRWWDRRQAAEDAQKKFSPLPAALSGDELKILHFYASPVMLEPGQKGLLCYGVLNAESVRLEPALEALKPALNRCLEISPARTTKYKLTALDRAGNQQSAEFTLTVR